MPSYDPQQVALFRYQLIAPLVSLSGPRGTLKREMERLADGLRPLGPQVDLDELFWDQTTRRVAKDGTLSLKGKIFEAGPTLIGQRVTVRFDPFDLRRVVITTPDDQTQQAFPVDLEGNRRVRRNPPVEPQDPSPPDLEALEDLADEMDRTQNPDPDKENSDE